MLELYLRYVDRPEALNRDQYPIFEDFVRSCAVEFERGLQVIDLDRYNSWLKEYCRLEEMEL